MVSKSEVLIIGGGLAGLVCAIHMRKAGFSVLVIEKLSLPRHKVCGEYLSNEVIPYLNSLKIDFTEFQPPQISRLQFSTASGNLLESKLDCGGFGLSRYALDGKLLEVAQSMGCRFLTAEVQDVQLRGDKMLVFADADQVFEANWVLGAYGKRSGLDKTLDRKFINKRAGWMAVKAHYKGQVDSDVVALHSFRGGYCGVSRVENGMINVCYLAMYSEFKKHGSLAAFQKMVLEHNPHLGSLFGHASLVFSEPLAIAQISFEKKTALAANMMLIGDSAGLIHPLCGNGMAMAISSAKTAAECIILAERKAGRRVGPQSLEPGLNLDRTRAMTLNAYARAWKRKFWLRLWVGRRLSTLLLSNRHSEKLLALFSRISWLMRIIIRLTHGAKLKPARF